MNTQTKTNILVIDDVSENLRLLMEIMGKRGYTLRPASDGSYGLATAQLEPPDLILLDIMMPGMDGYEVCEQLKADARTCDIPVIFISGRGQVLDKMKAFSVGGVDYINKPFHPEEVLARVETHLALRKLQTHLEELAAARTADLRQEIVEHKRTGESLRASEQQYRCLVEQVTDGIGIVQDDEFVFVNDAVCDLLGAKPSRFSETLKVFSSEADSKSRFRKTLKVCSQDGQERWIEARQSEIRWEGKPALLVTMRDVTEQKRREQEINAERKRFRNENIRLRAAMKDRYKFGEIIGKSLAMQKVYELVAQAAATDANVVILGESGTGKDLIAQTIHELSQRRKHPFVPVNCGSIQETLFEREFFGHRQGTFTGALKDQPGFFDAAQQGTLFLDEVSELSLAMQVKLLRAIEDKCFTPVGAQTAKHADLRIIAATNRNLKDLVRQGKMRKDFFYRIHIIPITVPPLRERQEDIPLLVEHFLEQYDVSGKQRALPGRILDALYQRDWPGNIRQLQNVLQRYLTLKHLDFSDDVQDAEPVSVLSSSEIIQQGIGLREALNEFEKQIIFSILEHNHGHKNNTAAMLQIPPRTLRRKLEKYQIEHG